MTRGKERAKGKEKGRRRRAKGKGKERRRRAKVHVVVYVGQSGVIASNLEVGFVVPVNLKKVTVIGVGLETC